MFQDCNGEAVVLSSLLGHADDPPGKRKAMRIVARIEGNLLYLERCNYVDGMVLRSIGEKAVPYTADALRTSKWAIVPSVLGEGGDAHGS